MTARQRRRHEAEGGEALGQAEGDRSAPAPVRADRRVPIRRRAEVGAEPVHVRVAPAADEVLFFLTEGALLDQARPRLARRDAEGARAVEGPERVGEGVADEVEHARVGGAEGHLALDPVAVFVEEADVHDDLVAGAVDFLIGLDLDPEVARLGIDLQADVADLEPGRPGVARRVGLGRPSVQEDHTHEDVRQVLFGQRDLDLRRAASER